MKTLLTDSGIFGITFFGDGEIIKTVPMINTLHVRVNNPSSLLGFLSQILVRWGR